MVFLIVGRGLLSAQEAEDKPELRIPIDPGLPVYSGAGVNGTLMIEASGVMQDIFTPATKLFTELNPGAKIRLSYPSSNSVFQSLIDGKIRVGAMSRFLTNPEKKAFEQKFGAKILEICIAMDALEIVVHRYNPITEITFEQLDAIYSPAALRGGNPVFTWGDLGLGGSWQSQPVEIYGGAPQWGTTLTFEALVTWGVPTKPGIHETAIERIPDAVAKNFGAIGYTSLGRRNREVKSLPVAESAVGPFIACTPETLGNGSYPLRRQLYLYIVPEAGGRVSELIRDFLLLMLSREGQHIVSEAGMIPLGVEEIKKERSLIPPDRKTAP